MAETSPVKEWLKRFIRHGGRDSAKSKEDGSPKYGASSSANSEQGIIAMKLCISRPNKL
jgi:hypothetical protein